MNCRKCGVAVVALAFTGYVCLCPTGLKSNKENPDHKPLKTMQGIVNAIGATSGTSGVINYAPPDKQPKYIPVYAFYADKLIPSWSGDTSCSATFILSNTTTST